jgi:hypothetical protein
MHRINFCRKLKTTALSLVSGCLYSASHSRVTPENVGLQKKQKCNTFACHTYNEVRLCFGNWQKGSWQHEKIRQDKIRCSTLKEMAMQPATES